MSYRSLVASALVALLVSVSTPLAAGAGGSRTPEAAPAPRPSAQGVADVAASLAATSAFDVGLAIAHADAIAAFGARREGSVAEARAISYCYDRLVESGYAVGAPPFRLPSGRSRNLVAIKPGRSARRIVIGAHVDSKSPSPGANDNGSGVGALLELARVLKDADTEATVVFVVFGAEERWDGNPAHHHYGSKAYVASLDAAARARLSAMVSLDMVGVGTAFTARSMGIAPATTVNQLRSEAAIRGRNLRPLRDSARYGSSDHEPFERIGVPAAWIEWRTDPLYHTAGDRAGRLARTCVRMAGQTVEDWLLTMTASELAALRR